MGTTFQEALYPKWPKGSMERKCVGSPYEFIADDGTAYLFYQGNNDKGKSWYLSRVKKGWKDGLPFVINDRKRVK
jgi:hypothetical protein